MSLSAHPNKTTMQGDVLIVTRGGTCINKSHYSLKQKCYTVQEALQVKDYIFLLQYRFPHGIKENKRCIKNIIKLGIFNYVYYRLAQTKCLGVLSFTIQEEEWCMYYAARFACLHLVAWLLEEAEHDSIHYSPKQHLSFALRGAYRGAHNHIIQYIKEYAQNKNITMDTFNSDVYEYKHKQDRLLVLACRSGDLELVKSCNNYNTDALNAACEYGHLHIIEYFDDTYYNEEIDDMVLYHACKKGNLETSKKILELANSTWSKYMENAQMINEEALAGAACSGNMGLLDHIINTYFSDRLPNYYAIFCGACNGNKVHVLQHFAEKNYLQQFMDSELYDAFEKAYYNDSVDVIEYLVREKIIDLKVYVHCSVMAQVLMRGNERIVKMFLPFIGERCLKVALQGLNVFNNPNLVLWMDKHSFQCFYDTLIEALKHGHFALVYAIYDLECKDEDKEFWNDTLEFMSETRTIKGIQFVLRQGADDVQGTLKCIEEME
jgi:hypothetical protein